MRYNICTVCMHLYLWGNLLTYIYNVRIASPSCLHFMYKCASAHLPLNGRFRQNWANATQRACPVRTGWIRGIALSWFRVILISSLQTRPPVIRLRLLINITVNFTLNGRAYAEPSGPIIHVAATPLAEPSPFSFIDLATTHNRHQIPAYVNRQCVVMRLRFSTALKPAGHSNNVSLGN